MYDNLEIKRYPMCTLIPWVLTLILAITTLTFLILYINAKPDSTTPSPLVSPYHYVPIVESVFDSPENGAYAYIQNHEYDNLTTKYFPTIDIFNLKSSGTLSILENFKTYQQTSDYSCGCSCLVMSLYYLGTSISERDCVQRTDTNDEWGCNPNNLESAVAAYGYDYESNKNFTDETTPVRSEIDFENYVEDAIKHGEPVIILSADWGGHYLTIIGVDRVGKESNGDVFIVADPFDTTDHIQDGYNIWGVERLFWTMMPYISNFEDNFRFIRIKKKK